MKRRVLVLLPLFLWLAPAVACAADAPPPQQKEFLSYDEGSDLPEAPSGWALLGRLLGSLAIVLGLIVVAAYVLKRMMASSRLSAGRGKFLDVIQVTPLGGKRQILLVRVAGRLLVIGASGDNLSLLTELPDEDAAATASEKTPQPVAAPDAKRAEFLDVLKNAGRRIVGGSLS